MWDPSPLLLRKKLEVRCSLPLYGPALDVGFMAKVSLSFPTSFGVGNFLSTQCVDVSQLVSFEGNCSLCSCRFGVLCVGGDMRGACIAILAWNLCKYQLNHNVYFRGFYT